MEGRKGMESGKGGDERKEGRREGKRGDVEGMEVKGGEEGNGEWKGWR